MAEGYEVVVLQEAERQLLRLPKAVQANILARIAEFAKEPRPQMSKPPKGAKGVWRLRVGDYRVIYGINDRKRRIVVTQVGNRRDVYRGL
jgi:mRNA interferase RelE/StbE